MTHLRLVESRHHYQFIAMMDDGRFDMTPFIADSYMTEATAVDVAQAIADDEECSVEYQRVEV